MTAIPVLLDRRPRYMGGEGAGGSLLLLPLGAGTLLDEVVARCAVVTAQAPIVVPLFDADERYEHRLRDAYTYLDVVTAHDVFTDPLGRFDPADSLLVVAPEHYPAEGLSLAELAGVHEYDVKMVRHLLAFETTSLRTKELVHAGADGRVRRIQRYFEPITWPFAAAVLASRVPVSCLLTCCLPSFVSLNQLRSQLAEAGIPNQDVPYHGRAFDLMDEAGALALAERRVVASLQPRPAPRDLRLSSDPASRHSLVHASARVLGPVSIAPDAIVDAGALVVGPTLLGPGSRVGPGAVVAQCLVMPAASIEAGATVRHRVVVARAPEDAQETVRLRRQVRGVPTAAGPTTPRSMYPAIKAWVEPTLAIMALIALSPLLLAIAALVKLTSSGPVLYRALREGRDGRPFHCLKFRSMRTNTDVLQRRLASQQKMDGPQFKMDHDPRLTKIGGWLRRLNLDELPQLINVVRGEMSIVGPRPSPFRENQICIPWRNVRLSVRPGITGLWQVCRRDRAAGDFHQWIYYDLLYVRHQSLAVDLRISAATIVTLGGRRPAALERIVPKAVQVPVPIPAPPAPVGSWLSRRYRAPRAVGQ